MTERSALAAGLSVRVPRGLDAPAFARHVAQTWCAGGELPAQQLDDLLVIVSELTTNATLHGAGQIELRVSVDNGCVFGAVIDQGSGFAGGVRDHGIDEVGKKGLLIVAALADRWGIHEGSSHVWFELASRDEGEPVDRELGATAAG
ncbi:MAG TPA: ATP-binding protein [Solirubrobacteraceae bacterium]|nr:ATP-binding protein [Solirubrobacteraceae bacterium]